LIVTGLRVSGSAFGNFVFVIIRRRVVNLISRRVIIIITAFRRSIDRLFLYRVWHRS